MRITSYQEKMKKKTSEFSFQLEGTLSKDGFAEMINYHAGSILTSLWSIEGFLRPFEKITLPPVAQDSITLYNNDNGDCLTRILGIGWSSIKAEHDSNDQISFEMKGCATLNEDQFQAIQSCVRDKISVKILWSSSQQELPLDKSRGTSVKH